MTVVTKHAKGLLDFTDVLVSLYIFGISLGFWMPVAQYVESCTQFVLYALVHTCVLITHKQSVKENQPRAFKKQSQ